LKTPYTKKIFTRILFLFIGIAFFLIQSQANGGVEKGKQFLGEKHVAKGVECSGCHKEIPPSAPVPAPVCFQCHGGSYAKLAEGTKSEPNPHASHLDNILCESCHHSHKKSENICASCHDFELKVP